MDSLNFSGLILGVATFLIIGVFHPVVIKVEYYFGAKKSWWVFLLAGVAALVASVMIHDLIASTVLGVLAFSLFWSIGELFEQVKRVQRGWFPRNPKRNDYPFDEPNKSDENVED